MLTIPRRFRRRLNPIGILLISLTVFSFCFLLLPPNSPIRLAISFNCARLFNSILGGTTDRDAWLWEPAQYPLDVRREVGYLIKTGYGTKSRVKVMLEEFVRAGNVLEDDGEGFLIVGDFAAGNSTLGVEIHDAVKMVMDLKTDKSFHEHPRFVKYRDLQAAVESGNEDEATRMGMEYGWELDALKFVVGMKLAYERMPGKKWYIILDDDTFLIPSSLEMLLSHLDHKKPWYLGNAVGDYKGRFAHGGSAVLVSGQAMKQLFDHPSIVAEAFIESLDETWGDKLVATTFQKLGIYLDERYNHHFNGEPPELTRITSDKFCSPLVSFHGLREPDSIRSVGKTLSGMKSPVLWGQLMRLFGGNPIQDIIEEPVHRGVDYVGPTDERAKMWEKVKKVDDCRWNCERASDWCMAWKYDTDKHECIGSPWLITGLPETANWASGLNAVELNSLVRDCS